MRHTFESEALFREDTGLAAIEKEETLNFVEALDRDDSAAARAAHDKLKEAIVKMTEESKDVVEEARRQLSVMAERLKSLS